MFAVGGALTHFFDQLRLPHQRDAIETDDVLALRPCRIWIVLRFPSMWSTEISINMSMESELSSGFNNEAFVSGSSQVPDDHLQSFTMTFLWIVSESSHLGDGMSDIWASVVCQKQKHAHNA